MKNVGKNDVLRNQNGAFTVIYKIVWRIFLLSVSIPCLIAVMNFLAWRLADKRLVPDENVEFLPSYGYKRNPDDPYWTLNINAVVFRSGKSDHFKNIFLDTMVSFFSRYNEYDTSTLRTRLSIFLRDFQRGKFIYMSVCSKDPELHSVRCKSTEDVITLLSIGPTQEDGLVNSKLRISFDEKNLNQKEVYVHLYDDRITSFSDSEKYNRMASVTLIPYDGISVVSDIDDTIKVTNVGNLVKVLEATFVNNFTAVHEISEMYKYWLWRMNGSIHFHYVSSSPWLFANLLSDWIKMTKLPTGSMHLRKFRFEFEPWGVDFSLFSLLKNPTEYKISKIKDILREFPGRKFVLVGDSSEKDPEIYGHITREYPDQIICSLIRNCPHNSIDRVDPKRLERAFFDVPSTKYGLVSVESSRKGTFFDIHSMMKSNSCVM